MASSSKRLAKNTILLYIRTIITLLITLFTSRVILNSLGVNDFGLYNVVGGFVTIFSVISSSLTATTQRFLTCEIGKEEGSDVGRIFNASMSIHIYLAVILLILFEVIGVPVLNTVLNVPAGRMGVANFVYQLSVLSFLTSILATPFTAMVIATERMNVFAYISLMSAFLKLVVAYALYISPFDKLVVYAILLFSIALLERFVYSIYSRKHFKEIKFKLVKDRKEFSAIFKFAGMNFIGAFASIACNQGLNILLNIFFGVAVNAARAIAIQVQSAVERFTSDFMTALNPQITKEYASGNIDHSLYLSSIGSKFSFYLMLLMSSVFIARADYVLELWLGNVPDYTVDFVRLTICISLLNLLSTPVVTIILANGNLATFTFWIGGIRLLMIPSIYFALLAGISPQEAYLIVIAFESAALITRLIIVNKMVGRKFLLMFLTTVVSRAITIFVIIVTLLFYLNDFFPRDFIGFINSACINIVITAIVILSFGITPPERSYIYSLIKNKINRRI